MEKQRKNSTSIEDRRCLECSRHFSTTAALISHMKTHKSLDLALSDSSSRQSQTLPVLSVTPFVPNVATSESAPGPTHSSGIVLDISTVPPLQPRVSSGVMSNQLEPLPPAVSLLQASVDSANTTFDPTDKPTLTCDLCQTTLKSKGALVKHRVLNYNNKLFIL